MDDDDDDNDDDNDDGDYDDGDDNDEMMPTRLLENSQFHVLTIVVNYARCCC